MLRRRNRPITLIATSKIQLDDGKMLPPGQYRGIEIVTELETMGGLKPTKPQYRLSLSADEMDRVGMDRGNLIALDIDVSKQVLRNELAVA